MKTLLPTASRKRLEELLTYLGDRAGDFRKCFDINSEWCWKYADLMLRGLKKRKLGYAEGHHVVPASFYGKRRCKEVDANNLVVLGYGEHLYAHYCVAQCSIGMMHEKMVRAFLIMYRLHILGQKLALPTERELISAITQLEANRIRSMDKQVKQVDSEGRTHHWEDHQQANKDYREFNRDKINAQRKSYREANHDKICEQKRIDYYINHDKITQKQKEYRDANRETLYAKKKIYREANRDKILAHKKEAYQANRDVFIKKAKEYREANRDKILAHKKEYAKANRAKISARNKASYAAKVSLGYRYLRDHETGKQRWVFVGLPATPETPKSTSGAA